MSAQGSKTIRTRFSSWYRAQLKSRPAITLTIGICASFFLLLAIYGMIFPLPQLSETRRFVSGRKHFVQLTFDPNTNIWNRNGNSAPLREVNDEQTIEPEVVEKQNTEPQTAALQSNTAAHEFDFVDLGLSFQVPIKQISDANQLKGFECIEHGNASDPVDIGMPNVKPLFIVGSMKSGTTLIYRCLTMHDQVLGMQCTEAQYGPWGQKETHLLSRTVLPQSALSAYMNKWKHTIENSTYAKEEKRDDAIYVDGTPDYMLYPYVAPRLRRLFPGSRIVFLLRDPVDRLVSQYKQWFDVLYTTGTFDPQNPPTTLTKTLNYELDFLKRRKCFFGIDQYLGNVTRLKFEFQECNLNKIRTNNEPATSWDQCLDCLQGNVDWPIRSCYGDDMFSELPVGVQCPLGYFISRGLYAPQIAHYLRFFSTQEMLIVNFQDLQASVVDTVNKIAAFAGHTVTYTQEEVSMYYNMGKRNAKGVKEALESYKDDIENAKLMIAKLYLKPNQELYTLLSYMGIKDFKPFPSDAKAA